MERLQVSVFLYDPKLAEVKTNTKEYQKYRKQPSTHRLTDLLNYLDQRVLGTYPQVVYNDQVYRVTGLIPRIVPNGNKLLEVYVKPDEYRKVKR